VIPCRDEAEFIEHQLEGLERQDGMGSGGRARRQTLDRRQVEIARASRRGSRRLHRRGSEPTGRQTRCNVGARNASNDSLVVFVDGGRRRRARLPCGHGGRRGKTTVCSGANTTTSDTQPPRGCAAFAAARKRPRLQDAPPPDAARVKPRHRHGQAFLEVAVRRGACIREDVDL